MPFIPQPIYFNIGQGTPSTGGAGSDLWEQAFQETVSDGNFDTGSDGIDFKKYVQIWVNFDGFDLGGSTNYKLESKFNNSAVAEYDNRYLQNLNQGTQIGQSDLNVYNAGGTMTEAAAGQLFINLVNESGTPLVGVAQGSWYVDGEAGGYFNRSTVWFQWTNTALLTRFELVPDYGNASYVFTDATCTIMHTDG